MDSGEAKKVSIVHGTKHLSGYLLAHGSMDTTPDLRISPPDTSQLRARLFWGLSLRGMQRCASPRPIWPIKATSKVFMRHIPLCRTLWWTSMGPSQPCCHSYHLRVQQSEIVPTSRQATLCMREWRRRAGTWTPSSLALMQQVRPLDIFSQTAKMLYQINTPCIMGIIK